MGQKMVDRPEGLDQLNGGLFSNSGNAGDIVNGVSCQAHHFHNLFGGHAKAPDDAVYVVPDFLHRVVDLDMVTDELKKVFVPGNDDDVGLRLQPLRHRSNQIVGFVSLQFQGRNPVSFHDLLDIRDLRGQAFRHGRPVGLVFSVNVASKGGRLRIKGHHDVVRLVILEHLEKHLGKTEDRVGRDTLGIGEMPDGIEGTVDIRRAINQKKRRSVRHVCPCSSAKAQAPHPTPHSPAGRQGRHSVPTQTAPFFFPAGPDPGLMGCGCKPGSGPVVWPCRGRRQPI